MSLRVHLLQSSTGQVLSMMRAPLRSVILAPGQRLSGHNGDIKRAAHGCEPTREGAMAAFAKSWRGKPGETGERITVEDHAR